MARMLSGLHCKRDQERNFAKFRRRSSLSAVTILLKQYQQARLHDWVIYLYLLVADLSCSGLFGRIEKMFGHSYLDHDTNEVYLTRWVYVVRPLLNYNQKGTDMIATAILSVFQSSEVTSHWATP